MVPWLKYSCNWGIEMSSISIPLSQTGIRRSALSAAVMVMMVADVMDEAYRWYRDRLNVLERYFEGISADRFTLILHNERVKLHSYSKNRLHTHVLHKQLNHHDEWWWWYSGTSLTVDPRYNESKEPDDLIRYKWYVIARADYIYRACDLLGLGL